MKRTYNKREIITDTSFEFTKQRIQYQIQILKLIRFFFQRDQIMYNSLIDQAQIFSSQGVSVNYKEPDNVISILQNSKNI